MFAHLYFLFHQKIFFKNYLEAFLLSIKKKNNFKINFFIKKNLEFFILYIIIEINYN